MSDTQTTPESLGQTTARSARWSVTSISNVVVLQLATTAALARLLSPADFGVVAIGNVVLRLVSYFADMGVGRALVQRESVTDEYVRAGFWSSLATGAASTLVGLALSPAAAWLIHDPLAVPVAQGLSLSFFVASLSTTSLALLRREHRFKAITVVEASGSVTYLFAASGFAAAGMGPWSLVFGMLAQRLVVALVAYALTRHQLGFSKDAGVYRALLSFGTKVSVLSLLEYAAQNLDTIAVGRTLDSAALGFYSRGANLVTLPLWYLGSSISRVLLPSYSRLQSHRDRLAVALRQVVSLVGLVGLVAGFWMAGASAQLVLLVLGGHWVSSIPVAAVAAVAASLQLVSFMYGTVLESTARVRKKAIVVGAQVVSLAAAILVLKSLGLVGFAYAFLVSEGVALVLYSIVASDVRGDSVASALLALVPGLAWGAVCASANLGLAWLGDSVGFGLLLVLALQCAVGASVLLVALRTSGAGALAVRALGDGQSGPMMVARSLLGVRGEPRRRGA